MGVAVALVLLHGVCNSQPLTGFTETVIDWDDYASDFVVDAKQIIIPEYPNAFNPSIIRWKGAFLMTFRFIPYPIFSSMNSHIGYVRLNENFEPMGPAKLLETRENTSLVPSRAEDARLVLVGDRLYVVYADNAEMLRGKGGCRIYVAELHDDGELITITEGECLSQFDGESRSRRERNWVPFDYQGDLLLAYTLSPHVIFCPRLGTNSCETFCRSASEVLWEWGEIRGGTPAEVVDEEYLAFFHSSIDVESVQSLNKKMCHYFMGAYTFEKSPPFAIKRISSQPIIGKGFYGEPFYKGYWKPVRVVFPCGYIHDEDYIWIAYGRHDHECWLVKLEKRKFFDSLVPVSTSTH